jgi:hypothetical protein
MRTRASGVGGRKIHTRSGTGRVVTHCFCYRVIPTGIFEYAVVVVLWGGMLMSGDLQRGLFGWLFAMGVAGIAGGAGALWLGRRRLVAVPVGAAQQ